NGTRLVGRVLDYRNAARVMELVGKMDSLAMQVFGADKFGQGVVTEYDMGNDIRRMPLSQWYKFAPAYRAMLYRDAHEHALLNLRQNSTVRRGAGPVVVMVDVSISTHEKVRACGPYDSGDL